MVLDNEIRKLRIQICMRFACLELTMMDVQREGERAEMAIYALVFSFDNYDKSINIKWIKVLLTESVELCLIVIRLKIRFLPLL